MGISLDYLPQSPYEYTEEDAKKETELFNQYCGSCCHFFHLIGEMGLCMLEEGCAHKNPSLYIDLWDKKCEKWKNLKNIEEQM